MISALSAPGAGRRPCRGPRGRSTVAARSWRRARTSGGPCRSISSCGPVSRTANGSRRRSARWRALPPAPSRCRRSSARAGRACLRRRARRPRARRRDQHREKRTRGRRLIDYAERRGASAQATWRNPSRLPRIVTPSTFELSLFPAPSTRQSNSAKHGRSAQSSRGGLLPPVKAAAGSRGARVGEPGQLSKRL